MIDSVTIDCYDCGLMSAVTTNKQVGLATHIIVDGVRINETDKPRPWPVFVEINVASFGCHGFRIEAINRFKLMEKLGWKALEADAVRVGGRHMLFIDCVRKGAQ